MPLDSLVQQSPRTEDWGLSKVQTWTLKRCWRPQTCFLTGKQLWGKKAYYGVRMITGPGTPIMEPYWIDKKEYLFWQIKGNKWGR
jgi:hypothetical protein